MEELPEATVAAGAVTQPIPDVVQALGAGDSNGQEITVTFFTMKMTAGGRKFDVRLAENDTISDLKEAIWSLTAIPPSRQKILGLLKGRLPADHDFVSKLGLFDGKAFTCLGTKEGDEVTRASYQGPDVVDDLAVDFKQALARNPALDDRNKRRIIEAVAKLSIPVMNEPRPGKRLLVLDLDGTVLDTDAWRQESVHSLDFARPGLEDFLTAVYPHYDIVIWSQTSWRWLESKLIELNMVGHDHTRYFISFVLDRLSMFKVQSLRNGQPYQHEVKALEIIWRKYPSNYSAKNSLHIDDLGRNFVMNPGNGIKCKAFKDAKTHRHDRELLFLQNYLLSLLNEPDLSKVDHSHWRDKPGVKGP